MSQRPDDELPVVEMLGLFSSRSFRLLNSAFIACLTVCFVTCLARLTEAAAGDQLETHLTASSHYLHLYKASHSLKDLDSAVDEMGSAVNIDAFKPQTFIAQRRTLVRGWATVLRAIEQSYDPTYDPSDPNNQVIWELPDPRYIADPKAHALAVAAIAANQQNSRRAAYYHDVQNIDLRAQSLLQMSLNLLRQVEPVGTPPDFIALDGILRQAGISDTRRTKIDAMFYARPEP